jgi:hypothetical protein
MRTRTPSKDTREKMATLHEQMAACLRSDKSISECRDEMRKNYQATLAGRPTIASRRLSISTSSGTSIISGETEGSLLRLPYDSNKA